jgi:hypothetical protein
MKQAEDLSEEIASNGSQPTLLEKERIEQLKKEISEVIIRPINIMNKTNGIKIYSIAGGQYISNVVDSDHDAAYSTTFAYGGVKNSATSERFVLILDSNLKFDYFPGRGIKYTRLQTKR